MRKLAIFCLGSCLVACGGDDELFTEEEAIANFGCKITDGPEGSDEYVITCSDGSSAKISKGRNGLDGDSCTVEDKQDGTHVLTCTDGASTTIKDGEAGRDGESARVVEREEPAGEQCPQGGKALEFFVGDEVTPRTTLYECEGSSGCPAGFSLDPNLKSCVSLSTIKFEGRLTSSQELDKLPVAMRPTQPLVTISEDAQNATPCQGTLTYPTGLVPLEGYGGLSERVTYVFGNLVSYQLTMEVAGASWERDTSLLLPSHLNMTRGLETEFDLNGLPVRVFSTEVRTSVVKGIPRADNATQELYVKGRVSSAQAKAQLRADLPFGLSDWTPLLADDQVEMGLVVNDFNSGQDTSLICKVDRFVEVMP